MTYLEIVQQAFQKAGLRSTRPTTLANAIDITLDFKEWAQDSWRELQEESKNWWFRQRLDQSIRVGPAFTSNPTVEDFERYNIYADPNMTGDGITVVNALPNDPWIWGVNKLYTPNSAISSTTSPRTHSVSLEPNTKYWVYIVHDEIPSPDREWTEFYLGGDYIGRSTSPGTLIYSHTTNGNPDQTIGFGISIAYKSSISKIYIMRDTDVNHIAPDEYSMPTGLETLNWRTVSIYTSSKTDEVMMTPIRYEDWRTQKDTIDSAPGRPWMITERPDAVLQVWPVPDQQYTIRFDGVWDIDEMVLDTDTPGFNLTGAQTLPSRYHRLLVYNTALKYATHHADESLMANLDREYRAQHARLTERQRPPTTVPPGVLTGMTAGQYRRIY